MVQLHNHTEYSLLDGACKIKELVAKAAAQGNTALAITDHGYMYGVIDFYFDCKDAGIKPILGVELYTANDIRERDKNTGHITLLAKSTEGYHNLVKLDSIAATEGFYYKPRCDLSLLEQYHEGIICLSGCISGDIPKLLLAEKYDEAKALAEKYQAIFGEDYYIELQYHGLDEEKTVLPQLIKLAAELGIKTVATNDVHYIEKKDALTQRVLVCINTKRLVSDTTALGYGMPKEFYYKSEAEMRTIFDKIAPSAVDESDAIAAKCNVELNYGHSYNLPTFPTPEKWKDNFSFLTALCRAGLKKRYGNDAAAHLKQLDYELDTIKKMGFVDYMLIVYDFIRFAKTNDIPVGPGRGSAAGSIVAYCLGITNLDPVQYNLKFERFLNPERITMPDIDIDFSPTKREAVIDYVARKYGPSHLAQIATFGSFGAKSAIRDVGKALGMTPKETSALTSLVPQNANLDEAIKSSPGLRKHCAENPAVQRVVDIAKAIEGLPRNTGIHAAGVVLAPGDVSDYVPIARNKNSNFPVTQYNMGIVERVGMLKVDFLGLANLDTIEETHALVNASRENKEDQFNVWKVALDDEGVYQMLSRGESVGVFQLESAGMRDVLKRLKPSCFEDLIAVIALYRPGPMDSIPDFIKGKEHPEDIEYAHPWLEPILSTTYGQIVYQEQVMEIVRQMAGYSYGRSDLVRRAMSKKKPDVLAAERVVFINGRDNPDGTVDVEGCLRRGVPENVAVKLWDEMASFAAYAFNKSHAAAYADVAYRTAFLRCYFPMEYQAALLSSAIGEPKKILTFIDDCNRRGIKILPPDINMSSAAFTVEEFMLRFGLAAIKDAGKSVIQDIVEARGGVPFRDLVDLMERVPSACDKGTLTALIKSGALDGFPQNRAQMLAVLPTLLKKASAARKSVLQDQLTMEASFFTDAEETQKSYSLDKVDWPDIPDLTTKEKLDQEMEAISIYVSGNPMAEYQEDIEGMVTHQVYELSNKDEATDTYTLPSGQSVRVAGVITQVKQLTTKKDKRNMCSLVLSDQGGQVDATVFPKTFDAYGPRIKLGEPVILFGKLEDDASFGRKLIVNAIDFLAQPKNTENGTK